VPFVSWIKFVGDEAVVVSFGAGAKAEITEDELKVFCLLEPPKKARLTNPTMDATMIIPAKSKTNIVFFILTLKIIGDSCLLLSSRNRLFRQKNSKTFSHVSKTSNLNQ